MTEYDPHLDAFECWKLAIAELRKRGVREGRFTPETDEEKRLVPICSTCSKPLNREQIQRKRRFCSHVCVRRGFWYKHGDDALIKLHKEGLIYSIVATRLGCTRNSVIGRIRRLRDMGVIVGRGNISPPVPTPGYRNPARLGMPSRPHKAPGRPRNAVPKPTVAPLAAIPFLPSSLPLFETKPLGEPASLMERHQVGCCFIAGRDHIYCNHHRQTGSSYCRVHHPVVWHPVPVRVTKVVRIG